MLEASLSDCLLMQFAQMVVGWDEMYEAVLHCRWRWDGRICLTLSTGALYMCSAGQRADALT